MKVYRGFDKQVGPIYGDVITESIKPLNPEYSNSKVITSEYDLINYMNQNPDLRILYDKRKQIYLVDDVEATIHNELIGDAIQTGYYSDVEMLNNLEKTSQKYFDDNENNFYSFVSHCDELESERFAEDNYIFAYHYPDITIFTRDENFEQLPLYKALGKCQKENNVDNQIDEVLRLAGINESI